MSLLLQSISEQGFFFTPKSLTKEDCRFLAGENTDHPVLNLYSDYNNDISDNHECAGNNTGDDDDKAADDNSNLEWTERIEK